MTPGRRRALVVGILAIAAALAAVLAPRIAESLAMGRARSELLAVPVYQVLEKHESALFEQLVGDYARMLRGRISGAEYVDLANAEIASAATRRIAHASDAALLALMQDMLDKLRLLRARSPDDCYRYLFPKIAGAPALARWVDRESQARTLALMADVIRTAAEQPVEVPARIRVEPLLGPVINDVYAQYGERTRLLSHAEEPGVDRGTVCAISVTLYEKILRLPPADAAAVIRTMTQL